MELLDQITIEWENSDAVVELLNGDLSSIPPVHKVDLLLVSAFPNSYTPNPGTLFTALYRKGFDMQKCTERKDTDLRRLLNCWISETLPPRLSTIFNFRQIFCF